MINSRRQFVPTPGKNKRITIAVILIIVVLIFSIPMTRNIVRKGANIIGTGILRVTNSVEGLFSGIGTAFTSKTSLLEENRNLKIQLADINAKLLSYDSVVAENTDLKASMGRADTMHLALATILSKPSSSAYDTLLIDGGEKALFVVGETVYANGEIPIGKIEHVDVNTALVRLYSSPKFTTEARLDVTDEKGVKHIDVTLTGRGGGNFQTSVPHDLKVESGTQVFSKELKPHLMAIFQKVTSDARDPFQTMLLSSPVNIQELSFVEVGQ